ncbi:MAG TPA: amylo-alpha-1,6-glucosidase [Bryobacteraceae bacterium]|nr:amylo-alpha-1,6-glucosidase [Bryobacteraceae bacterium]
MIEFGPEICGDLETALTREWLETNGIGGFASSTILCINTRRYHALLTAALEQPAGRFVLLSKLEATVMSAGAEYPLCSNVYPGAIYPAGFQFLRHFRLDPFPVFTFEAAGRVIEKRIVMARGENTVVVEYRLLSGEPCALLIRPMIAFRGYHETAHENTDLSPAVTEHDGGVSIQPYAGLPRLFFSFTAGERLAQSDWYRNFVYPRESERGLEDREDLFSPFAFRMNLSAGEPARVVASTIAGRGATEIGSIFKDEARRRTGLQTGPASSDPLGAALREAADAFLIRRPNGTLTVIAGYHWFTDWGRDTMISLPGLALVTGRFDLAREILSTWAALLDGGMLPNRFPDGGAAPEYNSVDASLWLFEAVRKYMDSTGDLEFVRSSLYQPLLSVIDWYTRGTRFGIRCDSDGLIIAGGPGTQLTWMDAMVEGRPATPRHGKPVEIQALWYNALRVGGWLAREFRDADSERRLIAQSGQTRESFAARFWNQNAGCLFDVIEQPGESASIRPNQVIALSLGFPLIEGDRAMQILAAIERELLTPFGLRTLAPTDPQYRGTYEGGIEQRDGGYHQGTVWPWLLGHFITAYLRTHNPGPQAVERARAWLSAFEAHLSDAGLGFISEIFDGDPPHRPRGCIAQAWSVAEILRAYNHSL